VNVNVDDTNPSPNAVGKLAFCGTPLANSCNAGMRPMLFSAALTSSVNVWPTLILQEKSAPS